MSEPMSRWDRLAVVVIWAICTAFVMEATRWYFTHRVMDRLDAICAAVQCEAPTPERSSPE